MKLLNFFLVAAILFFVSCKPDLPAFRAEHGTIKVKKGQEFKIVLKEDHAAGQSWTLVQEFDYKLLEYIKSNYHGPQSGEVDFIFLAEDKGSVQLRFNLVEYSEVIKSQQVNVVVE